MGYRNIGRGEICALITNNATITKNNNIGISQILFDFKESIRSCFIVSNICHA